jgi:hypothetical protein
MKTYRIVSSACKISVICLILVQEQTNPLAGKSALASRYPRLQYNGIGRSTTLRSLIHVPPQDEVLLGGIMGNILTAK